MLQKMGKQIDMDAFALLYECHAPALFAYLIRHTMVREDARDLLVEVFLAALEDARFSELEEKQQRSWLWRVARNKAIDLFRRAGRRQSFSLNDAMDGPYFTEDHQPEHIAMRNEEHAHLRGLIGSLTTQQQQVLQLRFVHDLPSREIAQVMGKKEGAIRMLLSRTLNLLHSMYERS
jgi:RNA polymerase sigma-70 factor (ECF subfamily)